MLYRIKNTSNADWETIEGEQEQPQAGIVRVTGYGGCVNLAPGDRLRVVGDRVVGIHRVAPLWVFEVYANIPTITYMKDPFLPEGASIHQVFAGLIDLIDPVEWESAGETGRAVLTDLDQILPTQSGGVGLVTKVSMESRAKFDLWLDQHPAIAFYDVLRRPGDTLQWNGGLPDQAPLTTVLVQA